MFEIGVWIISTIIFSSVVLGLVAFLRTPKEKISRIFLIMTLCTAVWQLSNFLENENIGLNLSKFFLRLDFASAILVAYFWFSFVSKFSQVKKFTLSPLFKALLFFVALLLAVLSFTDLSILNIHFSEGAIVFDVGYLWFLYGWGVAGFFIAGYIILIFNLLKSQGSLKMQNMYILTGAVISSGLAVLINLFLANYLTVAQARIGLYGTIVFIFCTFYAIIKHHLFSIRVIATELFTLTLWTILLFRIFLSDNSQDLLINLVVFIAVAAVGVLLVKSVLEEVEQKEKIEKLAKEIKRAYEMEKIAREKINATRVEDEALLSSIGDGVIAVNKNGEIMFINRSAEQMLGLKSEEAINRPYEEVLIMKNAKEEFLLKDKNPIYDVLKFGKKITTDAIDNINTHYYVRSDNTKFPAAITVAPIILNGKIIGAVDVFRDVTIERQIDKSKSEFVSLASHQLRTPLSAIKWYSEILLNARTGKLSLKQKKYLKEIYRGNERILKLIDIMLSVSRTEAGTQRNNPEHIEIKKLIENIVKEQDFVIKNKKQKFIFNCPADLPEIIADPNLVRIIFQNIISNAVKYTPDSGRITCDISKGDSKISFKISDTGIGIPKDQQKRIFGKLFRASNASMHDPEGNGLGLYLAKTTAENLGGKIWFESKEGEGTTFFIEIPFK